MSYRAYILPSFYLFKARSGLKSYIENLHLMMSKLIAFMLILLKDRWDSLLCSNSEDEIPSDFFKSRIASPTAINWILYILQREKAVERFREGKTWILIATDIMARGMDFKAVNCVINFDFPSTTASYIHRIGIDFLAYHDKMLECEFGCTVFS